MYLSPVYNSSISSLHLQSLFEEQTQENASTNAASVISLQDPLTEESQTEQENVATSVARRGPQDLGENTRQSVGLRMQELGSEIITLEAERDLFAQSLEQTQAALQNTEAQRQALEVAHDLLVQNLGQTQVTLQNTQAQNQALEVEHNLLAQSLGQIQIALQNAEEQIQALEVERDLLAQNLGQTQATLQNAQEQNQALEAERNLLEQNLGTERNKTRPLIAKCQRQRQAYKSMLFNFRLCNIPLLIASIGMLILWMRVRDLQEKLALSNSETRLSEEKNFQLNKEYRDLEESHSRSKQEIQNQCWDDKVKIWEENKIENLNPTVFGRSVFLALVDPYRHDPHQYKNFLCYKVFNSNGGIG